MGQQEEEVQVFGLSECRAGDRWFDYNGSVDVDRIKHGYDRNSNRLWRENVIAFDEDELYVYDGLNRLVDMRRGILNANKDAIATLEFAQDWSRVADASSQRYQRFVRVHGAQS